MFLAKIHYFADISKKSSVDYFKILFGMWGGSRTTTNRDIFLKTKFGTFDLKTNRHLLLIVEILKGII
jgi:hypothetical protein